jgi:hypothetical protein
VRDTDLPMGGIQVILVGDFLQLPPVSKSEFMFGLLSYNVIINYCLFGYELILCFHKVNYILFILHLVQFLTLSL